MPPRSVGSITVEVKFRRWRFVLGAAALTLALIAERAAKRLIKSSITAKVKGA